MIDLKIIDSNKVFCFAHYVGDGTNEFGETVELLRNPKNDAPIVRFDDGIMVTFSWDYLVRQAIEFKDDKDRKD